MTDVLALSLFAATPEQVIESRKRTHMEWARGLSMEEYLKRDEIMDFQEHAANGKLMTWVLASRSDPTTLDFKCSCETYAFLPLATYRRPVILATPTSSITTEALGYEIASVYTPPRNRGKGYATHMMRLLHWVLAPRSFLPEFPSQWGTMPESPLQDALFSVLYSDVGREFYFRAGPRPGQPGWSVCGVLSTHWDVPPQSDASVDRNQWRWLSRSDCIDIWEQDAELMKSDAAALAQKQHKTVFTFLPDNGIGQFSMHRLITIDTWLRHVYPPEPWGVQLVSSRGLTFATWTFEPETRVMVLTRLRSTAEDFPALLEALQFKAQEIGLDTIETWNIPEDLKGVGDQLGARTLERSEHLSAAKWYGSEPEEQVEWVFNEK
ncbi:uncharacterized protein PHACADRAFT_91589 [Phanerochaete carnosa HHB-10118-sp]|uniref:LYC1 C-terminal domain-containing protein n=1 Tax=Phanerochaete carnosa (strain HHB-10118-sp) TaxID=650164 RepID=K5V315_PHACS|nr:uncharacterized protein PHACADRAFT_91589 [Phanerochaete carnosa HHB-10118-sp]EKM56951.1 hypothetical protein PHACADRAFT_91589 [Phanerochaete carnosa HHB-10118-sp]